MLTRDLILHHIGQSNMADLCLCCWGWLCTSVSVVVVLVLDWDSPTSSPSGLWVRFMWLTFALHLVFALSHSLSGSTDYNPARPNYHPVDHACWDQAQRSDLPVLLSAHHLDFISQMSLSSEDRWFTSASDSRNTGWSTDSSWKPKVQRLRIRKLFCSSMLQIYWKQIRNMKQLQRFLNLGCINLEGMNDSSRTCRSTRSGPEVEPEVG